MNYSCTEMELLIQCLKSTINPCNSDKELIQSLLKKNINWNYFQTLVSCNRVIPLVWKAIKPERKNIPPAFANNIEKCTNEILSHHLYHVEELKNLLVLFSENKIPAIPFKGPALSKFYHNTALREWTDLDIIIQKKDIAKVEILFISNDYLASGQKLSERVLQDFHSFNFNKKDINVRVDVHWSISDEDDELIYPMDKLWERSSLQTFFNFETILPAPEDIIVTLCIHHGSRNYWNELRLVADLGAIIHFHKNLNWKQIISSARQTGVLRSLLTGVSLTHSLFKLSLPNEINKLLINQKSIKKIEQDISNEWYKNAVKFNKSRNKVWVNRLNKIKLRDGLIARAGLYKNLLSDVLKVLITPNVLDKKIVKLPKYLHFIYFIIKPFRLLSKYFLIKKKVVL